MKGRRESYKKYGSDLTRSWVLDTVVQESIETGAFGETYFEFEMCMQILIQRKQRQYDLLWE